MTSPGSALRVAVLGAGPVGVEAALAAEEHGWAVTLYEASAGAAGALRRWGHVRLFTPWALDVSPRMAARFGLPDAEACPTGSEVADYLDRAVGALADVRLRTRVVAVSRSGLLKHEQIASPSRADHPFRLLVEGPDGSECTDTADVVLDCTGTYDQPRPTGDGGIPAPGERALGERIVRHLPQPTPQDWSGQRVLLVGAGNSAQTAARDLHAAGATLTWALRSPEPTWGAVAADPLPDRAALVASSRRLTGGGLDRMSVHRGVTVTAFAVHGEAIRVELRAASGATTTVTVDRVVSLTGYVGDATLYRQLQVHECYATEGPMALAATLLGAAGGDCLTQVSAGVDALRSPEPRFFILGSKSYGRGASFLLRVGWDQVAEVVAALAAEAAGADSPGVAA